MAIHAGLTMVTNHQLMRYALGACLIVQNSGYSTEVVENR